MRFTKEERENLAYSFLVNLEKRGRDSDKKLNNPVPYMRGYLETVLSNLMYDNPEVFAAIQGYTNQLKEKNESV